MINSDSDEVEENINTNPINNINNSVNTVQNEDINTTSINNTQFNDITPSKYSLTKDPPSLKDAKNYEDWLKLLKIWGLYTTIPPTKQGPSLILSLTGEARDAALELKTEDISSANGVTNIITKLNSLYKADNTLKKFNTITNFENFKRKADCNIQQYIIDFEKNLNKTKTYGTSWSDDVLAIKLLKNANLAEEQQQLAKATLSELSYDNMKDKLKTIFGEAKYIPPENNPLSHKEINLAEEEHTFYNNLDEIDTPYEFNDEFNEQFDQLDVVSSEEVNDNTEDTLFAENKKTNIPYMHNTSNLYNNYYNSYNRQPQSYQQRFPNPTRYRSPNYQTRQSYRPNLSRNYQNNNRYQINPQYRSQLYPRRFYTQHNLQQNSQVSQQQQSQQFNNNKPRINPPSRCSVCQSINHWAANCPEKDKNTKQQFFTQFSDIEL